LDVDAVSHLSLFRPGKCKSDFCRLPTKHFTSSYRGYRSTAKLQELVSHPRTRNHLKKKEILSKSMLSG